MHMSLRTTLFLFAVFTSLFAIPTAGLYAAEPTKLILGTATKGGGFQLFGKHLIEVINETSTGIRLEEQATKGSKQNLPFLETGKIDVGLVEGNAARQALEDGHTLWRQPLPLMPATTPPRCRGCPC